MADDDPLMAMRTTRRAEVAVSLEDMYRLLVAIDSKVTTLTVAVSNSQLIEKDHEQRIRELEHARTSESRVTAMEDDVKVIRSDLESLKVKVYAIPGASVVIAAIAVVLTVARMI